MFKPYLLTGLTGSGKTRIIQYLNQIGFQVLDIERIADHSGSVFGGINRPCRVSQDLFNQDIWMHLQSYDVHKPIFMEWKGPVVGHLVLPEWLLRLQEKALHLYIDTPYEIRLQHVMADYESLTLQQLQTAFGKIEERMPLMLRSRSKKHIGDGDRTQFIETLITYFDQSMGYKHMKDSAHTIIDIEGGFSEEAAVRQMGVL